MELLSPFVVRCSLPEARQHGFLQSLDPQFLWLAETTTRLLVVKVLRRLGILLLRRQVLSQTLPFFLVLGVPFGVRLFFSKSVLLKFHRAKLLIILAPVLVL